MVFAIKERGQTSLVLIIGLLVLAIGMYTTYTVSRTVYEKIKLQNAVDAVAYSIATREARAFNFAAFANRVQIANYVQLLEEHGSYSSEIYQVGMLGFWGDVLQSASKIPGMSALDYMGQQLESMHTSGTADLSLQQISLRRRDLAVKTANSMFLFISAALFLSAAAQAAEGDMEVAHANDQYAEANDLTTVLNTLNLARFAMTLDVASFAPELTDETAKLRAQRLIAEIANASRFGETSYGIVDRERSQFLDQFMGGLTGSTAGIMIGNINDTILRGSGYVGTTKLVDDAGSLGFRPPLEQTASSQADNSYLNPGTVVMSKDTTEHGLLSDIGFASVTSSSNGTTICSYKRSLVTAYGNHIQQLMTQPTAQGFVCEESDMSMSGIGRYIGFKAPRDTTATSTTTRFNQPDVWMFLIKKPDTMRLPVIGDLRFRIDRGAAQAKLDATPESLTGGVLDGFTALARAQVYYHRPGAWQEPPNFFNPYWNARLAPKREALDALTGDTGLSGAFVDLITDNVTMF